MTDDGPSNSGSSDDDDDEVSTLSIVRFAREVNQRRISVDLPALDRAAAAKLDITNFPSGPLVDKSQGGDEMEMRENRKRE